MHQTIKTEWKNWRIYETKVQEKNLCHFLDLMDMLNYFKDAHLCPYISFPQNGDFFKMRIFDK